MLGFVPLVSKCRSSVRLVNVMECLFEIYFVLFVLETDDVDALN